MNQQEDRRAFVIDTVREVARILGPAWTMEPDDTPDARAYLSNDDNPDCRVLVSLENFMLRFKPLPPSVARWPGLRSADYTPTGCGFPVTEEPEEIARLFRTMVLPTFSAALERLFADAREWERTADGRTRTLNALAAVLLTEPVRQGVSYNDGDAVLHFSAADTTGARVALRGDVDSALARKLAETVIRWQAKNRQVTGEATS